MGFRIPGVSEYTIWKSSPETMPMIRWRVVCALEVMIERRSPTRAFMSVDLPTLGLPMMFTKPLLCMLCNFVYKGRDLFGFFLFGAENRASCAPGGLKTREEVSARNLPPVG